MVPNENLLELALSRNSGRTERKRTGCGGEMWRENKRSKDVFAVISIVLTLKRLESQLLQLLAQSLTGIFGILEVMSDSWIKGKMARSTKTCCCAECARTAIITSYALETNK